VTTTRGRKPKKLNVRPNVDWDAVEERARKAYHENHLGGAGRGADSNDVIDSYDFEAGYRAAVREFAPRIGLADAWQVNDPLFTVVDVQVDKGLYRMLHGTTGKSKQNGRA